MATICLPTEESGSETRKSPIRFKNLMREALDKLEGVADGGAVREQIEKNCKPLIEDHDFWQHQSPGLLVLCERDKCQLVRLPFSPTQRVYVGDRFHVKPLLQMVNRDQTFFVLALSVNSCRLFWGDQQSLDPVEVEGLPPSLEEALQYDDPEQSLQFHTQSPGGAGGRAAMFHGHGGGKDDPQAQLDRYITIVAKTVSDYLKDDGMSNHSKAPLVLACVEEHAPLFAENNSYPGLIDGGVVKGNPDDFNAEELHQQAWPLVEKVLRGRVDKLLEDFESLRAHDKASIDPGDISRAIQRGQVATVFVAEDTSLFGAVDPVSGQVNISDDEGPDGDVLNDIAAEALLQGGDSYLMPAEQIPGGSGVAAIYRY